MLTKGAKRKYLDDVTDSGNAVDPGIVPSYDLQRQSLLDMSLIKLQLCHMLVEPDLCRSVLIANTVRQIREEMTQDGSWQLANTQKSFQTCFDRLLATDILCRASPSFQTEELITSNIDSSNDTAVNQVQDELSLPAAVSPVQTQESKPFFCHWKTEDHQKCQVELCKSGDPVFATLEVKSSDLFESPLDDLFSDVDTSQYDLDSMLTGMLGGSRIGHYDLLDSLSTASPSGSSRKVDLSELDHIMEILVGS
ncbi:cell division cycle-associated protein 4 [Protopterus annectens]|uniref:cell division cycle-associated protein 4 n=1 Tax=Protopterus annectens TaxID=7888 RepID=UPI001CFAC00C|nr:cell division cycle-associated protein 4 [Protopterus annectens]